jgi:ketosteroid isomerase-like protein
LALAIAGSYVDLREGLRVSDTGAGAVAREFFSALAAGDIEALIAALHPDIVWEVPGVSPVAGRHVGLDAVGAMMLTISAMAEGTEHVQIRELFVNAEGAVALVDVDMTPPGDEPWHGDDAWLLRSDGKQVTYIREHWFDTRGFDDLTAWAKA